VRSASCSNDSVSRFLSLPDHPADPDQAAARAAAVGLCFVCVHAKCVRSARGSEFWLCQRHEVDARFSKYPRLPVIWCSGHQRATSV